MAIDPSAVMIAGIMAAAQLGAVKLLVDRSFKKLDDTATAVQDHSVLLAQTTQTQKTTAETLERVQASISELYESRNEVKEEVKEIQTLHKLRRCEDNVFFQGPKGGSQL